MENSQIEKLENKPVPVLHTVDPNKSAIPKSKQNPIPDTKEKTRANPQEISKKNKMESYQQAVSVDLRNSKIGN